MNGLSLFEAVYISFKVHEREKKQWRVNEEMIEASSRGNTQVGYGRSY
jgi:hypothetical protein